MDMEFPRMVYRLGTMAALEAGTFDHRVVTADEWPEAEADGWFLDQFAAAAAGQAPGPVGDAKGDHGGEEAQQEAHARQGREEVLNESGVDDSPPTREELETKAKELGIKFDGRTGDAKLAAKIAEALKA